MREDIWEEKRRREERVRPKSKVKWRRVMSLVHEAVSSSLCPLPSMNRNTLSSLLFLNWLSPYYSLSLLPSLLMYSTLFCFALLCPAVLRCTQVLVCDAKLGFDDNAEFRQSTYNTVRVLSVNKSIVRAREGIIWNHGTVNFFIFLFIESSYITVF